jgi:3-methyladenine DNA glycosylase Mpg
MRAAWPKVPELLPPAFYLRDPRKVAVELLNKLLVHDDPVFGRIGGRIVEVEAYLGAGIDPGSHAFRGPGKRNATMFGCSGPARLTQALGVTGALDGTDLAAGPVLLLDDGTPAPKRPGNSVRIGLSPGKGDKSPWRWWVPGDPNVSVAPRS